MTATVEIRRFDPQRAGAAEWRAWHELRRRHALEDAPELPVTSDAQAEDVLRRDHPLVQRELSLAWRGDEPVGSLLVAARREGSPEYEQFRPYVNVWGAVARAERRQGIATLLARRLLAAMDERGASTATTQAAVPDGHAFLARIGACEKHRDVESRLELGAVAWDDLERWQREVPAPLRWEIHAPRVPLARLEPLLEPFSVLLADAPTGALSLPPRRFELELFRSMYETMDRRGGEHLMVLLFAGAELAAICAGSWSPDSGPVFQQQFTAVARAWRGRGVATAIKARLLLLVRERLPAVPAVVTTNAAVNEAILRVNARLGFAPLRRLGVYQIGRAELAASLTPARGA